MGIRPSFTFKNMSKENQTLANWMVKFMAWLFAYDWAKTGWKQKNSHFSGNFNWTYQGDWNWDGDVDGFLQFPAFSCPIASNNVKHSGKLSFMAAWYNDSARPTLWIYHPLEKHFSIPQYQYQYQYQANPLKSMWSAAKWTGVVLWSGVESGVHVPATAKAIIQ